MHRLLIIGGRVSRRCSQQFRRGVVMARGRRRAPSVRARRRRIRRGTAPRHRRCRAGGIARTCARVRHRQLRRLPADVRKGVTITTPDGYAVTLVHLGSIGVAKGDTVTEGAPIGGMGWSGDPEHDVPTVHLGIRVGEWRGVPRPARPPAAAAAPPAPASPPAPHRCSPPRPYRSRRPDADAGVRRHLRPPAQPRVVPAPVAPPPAPSSGSPTRDARERAGCEARPTLLGRSGRDGGLAGPTAATSPRPEPSRGAVPRRPRHPGRHPGPSVADIVGVRRAGGRSRADAPVAA